LTTGILSLWFDGEGLQQSQDSFPIEIRLPHCRHSSVASHCGQRPQLFFTSQPHWGQAGAVSRVSHTGHRRHEGLVGSPQWGQMPSDGASIVVAYPCYISGADEFFNN
jgi:hypothetical protein